MYIDSSFAFCPACNSIVSLSWGWCPYHATREQLLLKDDNGDGKFKDEFIYANGKQTIEGVLNSPFKDKLNKTNSKRLLVHWSEFIIG